MDTRFLQSLISVIETGSIAAAARKENVTAAAISQRIQTLETLLETRLLSRTGHTARPTDDCLRILPRLNKIIFEVEQIRHDLDDTGLSGVLNMGVVSSTLIGLLPRTIQYLALHTPNLLLKIVPGSSQDLYQALLDKRLDLAIVVAPRFELPKVLKRHDLFSEPLCLISYDEHPSIDVALKNRPYIQYDKGSWGGVIANQYLDSLIVKKGFAVNLLCDIDSLESIVLMVKQNMGVSIIPKWEGLNSMAPELHTIDIMEYQREMTLLSHRQAGKDKLLSAFDIAITQSIV